MSPIHQPLSRPHGCPGGRPSASALLMHFLDSSLLCYLSLPTPCLSSCHMPRMSRAQRELRVHSSKLPTSHVGEEETESALEEGNQPMSDQEQEVLQPRSKGHGIWVLERSLVQCYSYYITRFWELHHQILLFWVTTGNTVFVKTIIAISPSMYSFWKKQTILHLLLSLLPKAPKVGLQYLPARIPSLSVLGMGRPYHQPFSQIFPLAWAQNQSASFMLLNFFIQ